MANILKTEKKVAVISMLAEGSSIRAIERITAKNPARLDRGNIRAWQGIRGDRERDRIGNRRVPASLAAGGNRKRWNACKYGAVAIIRYGRHHCLRV